MPCHECAALNAHDFRSPDDLVHAFQVAAAELDRGVLERLATETRSGPEQDAIDSAFASNELPGHAHYRFRCTTCGDRFELSGDIGRGTGSWTREAAELETGGSDRSPE